MRDVLITSKSDGLSIAAQDAIEGSKSLDLGPNSKLEAALNGVGTVLHLQSYFELNDFKRLLEACVESGISHFVLGSSTCVYGAWPNNPVPLTESSPLRPNQSFERAIRLSEAERLVRESGLNWTVLRFASVVSDFRNKPDLAHLDLYRHTDSGRPVQFLHIEDAVSAVQLVVSKGLSGVFNATPTDFVGDAKARAIAGNTNKPSMPRRIARFANEAEWQRRHRSTFDGASNYFEYPWVASSDKLCAEGWRPTHSSSEAIAAYTQPTLWNRLRPQQRRELVNASLVSGTAAAAASAVGGAAFIAVRRRRSS